MIKDYPDVTVPSLLFTLSSTIWAARRVLIKDFGMSEREANIAILIAVDAEKQITGDAKRGEGNG